MARGLGLGKLSSFVFAQSRRHFWALTWTATHRVSSVGLRAAVPAFWTYTIGAPVCPMPPARPEPARLIMSPDSMRL